MLVGEMQNCIIKLWGCSLGGVATVCPGRGPCLATHRFWALSNLVMELVHAPSTPVPGRSWDWQTGIPEQG